MTPATQDWRDVAGALRLWWTGMRFLHGEPCEGEWPRGVVVPGGWINDDKIADDYGRHTSKPSSWIPDLSDPDTRAAYDRRLALALGAPVEAVGEGVRFYLDGGAGWQMDAGFKGDDVTTHAWHFDLRALGNEVLTNTDDPLLARALAWPADKREAAPC